VEQLLTVYFGTPNMFITLWFGFDYGTNDITSSSLYVHLEVLCFCRKNMDIKDGVTTSSKEQLRSPIRVREHDEITPKGGKDQSVT
jgi:hypothetical protein